MSITEQLLAEIEAFLVQQRISATRFGKLACNDPHAVRWLRDGGSITTRRYEQLRAFMRSRQESTAA